MVWSLIIGACWELLTLHIFVKMTFQTFWRGWLEMSSYLPVLFDVMHQALYSVNLNTTTATTQHQQQQQQKQQQRVDIWMATKMIINIFYHGTEKADLPQDIMQICRLWYWAERSDRFLVLYFFPYWKNYISLLKYFRDLLQYLPRNLRQL